MRLVFRVDEVNIGDDGMQVKGLEVSSELAPEEYQEMIKSPMLLQVWQMFTKELMQKLDELISRL